MLDRGREQQSRDKKLPNRMDSRRRHETGLLHSAEPSLPHAAQRRIAQPPREIPTSPFALPEGQEAAVIASQASSFRDPTGCRAEGRVTGKGRSDSGHRVLTGGGRGGSGAVQAKSISYPLRRPTSDQQPVPPAPLHRTASGRSAASTAGLPSPPQQQYRPPPMSSVSLSTPREAASEAAVDHAVAGRSDLARGWVTMLLLCIPM